MNKYKEFPFTEIDLIQMDASLGSYNINNPIWKRAFTFYNENNEVPLQMTCRPCYRKVLEYIKYAQMAHNRSTKK